MRTDELARELREARDGFFELLESVEPASLTTPGLVGEWSARELVAHLGYWAGHGTEAIQSAEMGPLDQDPLAGRTEEEVNETVARVARQTDLGTVRRREAASFAALVERIGQLDPSLLDVREPDGRTLEEAIRVNGPEHYREHADELRRVLDQRPHG